VAVCPDQFFGFLEVNEQNWHVSFPRCETFMPTQHAPVRNEFAILASSTMQTNGSHEVGVVLLQFQNTSASDTGWYMMAKSRSCTQECITREVESGAMTVLTLHVQCPPLEQHADYMPTLKSCTSDSPSLLLLPAGERVKSTMSNREGAMCDWTEAPHVVITHVTDWLPSLETFRPLLQLTAVPFTGLLLAGKSLVFARVLHTRVSPRHEREAVGSAS